jgi:F-type H+-transporting ATPase subunit b
MNQQMVKRNQCGIVFMAALALALVFLLVPPHAAAMLQSNVAAQASPAQDAHASSAPQSSAAPSDASSAQLAAQSKQAAGEQQDETAQFKHSDAVRWIAEKTGMTMHQAYIAGVGFNFAVFAGLIIWACLKGLPKMFRSRTASIQQSMLEARKTSEEARRRLSEIENRLSHLDSEIAQLRSTAEREAGTEEERVKAAAIEESKRIVESAEQEIAAATKAARRELTKYASGLAVSLAQKQIRVDSTADQRLMNDFLEQLANGTGKGQN